MIDDALGLTLAVAAFVFLIFAVVAAGSVLAMAAIPGAIGYGIYWHQVKSPKARERRKRRLEGTGISG